jgi:DNA-binding response OmpR family regulator
MPQHRVIVIEDSQEIAELLRLHLSDIGLQVEVCHDGDEGARLLSENDYDLVILDIMLPGRDGLSLCRQIREDDRRYTPILMLTSRSSEMDRVLGLETGADDYLTKPFSLMEMVARSKALIRRHQAMQSHQDSETVDEHPQLRFEGLSIDTRSREVLKDGRPLELTAKEYDLLLHFARHPGQVFNRMQLLDSVWGYAHVGYEHTVNTHINRLRSKLENDPRNPRYIKTVWGVGYRFIGGDKP